jgi:Na+-driven multidrug efflux pump
VWPYVCALIVADSVFGIAGGLLRGLGLNGRSSWVVIGSLWLVGLPLMLFVAHTIELLWMLMLPIYMLLDGLLVLAAVCCVSWQRLSDDARERGGLAKADSAAAAARDLDDASSTRAPTEGAGVELTVGAT